MPPDDDEWIPLGIEYRRSGSKITRMMGLPAVFLSDSDDPGELVSRGRCGGLGDGSPAAESRVVGGGPWSGLETKPPEIGVWGEAPCWTGFNDYKDILSAILLIKSCIYSIIRSLTSVLIFSRQLLK